MTGETAFSVGRSGLSGGSAALTRNLSALAEQVAASQARAIGHSVTLLGAMFQPPGAGLGAVQADLRAAVSDAAVDARRLGELWLAVVGAAMWPLGQFFPDATADDLPLPD